VKNQPLYLTLSYLNSIREAQEEHEGVPFSILFLNLGHFGFSSTNINADSTKEQSCNGTREVILLGSFSPLSISGNNITLGNNYYYR
jgi:hypothetical protein